MSQVLCQVVLIYDFLWDVGEFDAHILWVFQGHVEVEGLDVEV